MKTLYISDLDGTLLNSHAELSKYTTTTLNRLIKKEVPFGIATARTAATALLILEHVALNTPIILLNGVLVYDPTNKQYIKKETLSRDVSMNIIQTMRKAGQTGLMYTLCGEEMFTYYESLENKALREFVDERITKYNKVFEQVHDLEEVANDTIYFTFLDRQEKIGQMYSLIEKMNGIKFTKYRDIYSEDLWYLEIFSTNASKYNAVQFLRDHCGYERIISFGDNLNDIPLFQGSDECYAVANARNELKVIATAVIESNNDDGVAKWLEKNVT